MRWFLMTWLFLLPLFGLEAYKGKSLILTLPSPSGHLSLEGRTISIVPHPSDPTQGMAIFPIDYYAPEGESILSWNAPDIQLSLPLRIQNASYRIESLHVDPAKIAPPPEALERIAREKREAEAIYGHFTPVRYWNRPFLYPLDSVITSPYGSARTYNGSFTSYHGGVDFRAKTPTPVRASNDGIVALAQDRYYSGGTIIIDHGEGLYTCYFHLSHWNLTVGDRVARGEIIGLSGKSGRITGPHLHFGIMIHGVQTDPLDLLTQLNTLLDQSPQHARMVEVRD